MIFPLKKSIFPSNIFTLVKYDLFLQKNLFGPSCITTHISRIGSFLYKHKTIFYLLYAKLNCMTLYIYSYTYRLFAVIFLTKGEHIF